jgi:crotonobetainyl-CoA:carnitine CoA-transferase CaiB-like acyl-CoA transferase
VGCARSFLSAIWRELRVQPDAQSLVSFTESGRFGGVFPVTDLAAASVASAGLSVADFLGLSGPRPAVHADSRLSSLWFGKSLHPIGWQVPPLWDPIAGDYEAADGWIRLHTNAPHHRAAALHVLGVQPDKAATAAAVRTWHAERLEKEIVDAAGCAAAMRTQAEWRSHAQGQTVSSEPLIRFRQTEAGAPGSPWHSPRRPLQGIRVLDLTRVLAGPVATRFLAGLGADVLRLDPPDWNEDAVVPEMTLGKRCARLDLRAPDGKKTFAQLLANANILVHGYRPGALDKLGFSERERHAIRPGLVDVSLDAYGWTGPWKGRRGFDSLVQMSSGIAAAGMHLLGRDRPTPLPVQALDHATGYLMAAAAIRGLGEQEKSGQGSIWQLSLARTAGLLTSSGAEPISQSLTSPRPDDMSEDIEQTSWGPARRMRPPLTISGAPLSWDYPASALGWSAPAWA